MSIKRWKLGLKRCNCVKCEAAITFEQTEENCGWVMWGDYKDEVTRLKAEVERLTAFTTRTIIPNEELQAQVERLTKENALATPRHLIASQDITSLREQVEELKLENSQYEEHHKYGQNVITSLRDEVERLTAKLNELENKEGQQ
jgi:chromosome segregation ATPase